MRENKEELVEKGYRYQMNLEGLTLNEFAKNILALVNHMSSNTELKIVGVKTYNGTELVDVDTLNKDTYNYLKQMPMDYHTQLKLLEEIEVVNISTEWLEEEGFVKDGYATTVQAIL